MQTGHVAVTTGVYRSECECRFDLEIRPGEVAPICPTCLEPVTWVFARGTYTAPPEPPPPS